MQPAPPPHDLTDAERAALPLISRAGLNILKMHGLRVVAERDIATIQAAYLRTTEQTQHLIDSMSRMMCDAAVFSLSCELHGQRRIWELQETGASRLCLAGTWAIETRTTERGVAATLIDGSTIAAVVVEADERAALQVLLRTLTE